MDEVSLLEISCRWCGKSFHVCHSCWRGQRYCTGKCKTLGYRKNRQKRQRKYRRTETGKKTHRKNENERKKRLARKKVGDATSNTISSLIPSSSNIYSNSPCCRFCGKKGRIVTRFPRRSYGRILKNESSSYFCLLEHHNCND